MAFPLLVSPLGWLALGAGGFVLYKFGKKKGTDERAAAQIAAAPESESDAAAEKVNEAPAKEQSKDKPADKTAEKTAEKTKKTNDSKFKTDKK